MAYLRDIEKRCGACPNRAVVELRNRFNASYGEFCRSCGKRRLKELQAEEAKASEGPGWA